MVNSATVEIHKPKDMVICLSSNTSCTIVAPEVVSSHLQMSTQRNLDTFNIILTNSSQKPPKEEEQDEKATVAGGIA